MPYTINTVIQKNVCMKWWVVTLETGNKKTMASVLNYSSPANLFGELQATKQVPAALWEGQQTEGKETCQESPSAYAEAPKKAPLGPSNRALE